MTIKTPTGIASLISLPSLTIQQAAMITGGGSEVTIDNVKPTEPVHTTNTEEPPIPGGTWGKRPPFG